MASLRHRAPQQQAASPVASEYQEEKPSAPSPGSGKPKTVGILLGVGVALFYYFFLLKETIGHIEAFSPEFHNVIASGAAIEVISKNKSWTEGPVWYGGADGYLLFSDTMQDTIFQWSAKQGEKEFLRPAGGCTHAHCDIMKEPGSNGLAIDPQGRLVACQHGSRSIVRFEADGSRTILASHVKTAQLNSPNDLVFAPNGDLYFTDPSYGLNDVAGNERGRQLDVYGVYRIAASILASADLPVSPQLVTPFFRKPNGIGFAPDGRTLYVSNSGSVNPHWMAFTIEPSTGAILSQLRLGEVEARKKEDPNPLGSPDGLTVDSNGNIIASAPGGLRIFSPKGTLLGMVHTDRKTSNVAFGNDGYLYITASSLVCRIKTNSQPWYSPSYRS